MLLGDSDPLHSSAWGLWRPADPWHPTRLLAASPRTLRPACCRTYSTLTIARQNKQSRRDQVVQWCGGTKFDGCLIFDE